LGLIIGGGQKMVIGPTAHSKKGEKHGKNFERGGGGRVCSMATHQPHGEAGELL